MGEALSGDAAANQTSPHPPPRCSGWLTPHALSRGAFRVGARLSRFLRHAGGEGVIFFLHFGRQPYAFYFVTAKLQTPYLY